MNRSSFGPKALLKAAKVPKHRFRGRRRYRKQHNCHPGNNVPVLVQEKGAAKGRVLRLMRWGLVPSFSKPDKRPDFFRMFNARSETVNSKSVFSRLLNRKRCVALFDGFYEWKVNEKGQRQPYYIRRADGQPLMLAGLFDDWKVPAEQRYSPPAPPAGAAAAGGGGHSHQGEDQTDESGDGPFEDAAWDEGEGLSNAVPAADDRDEEQLDDQGRQVWMSSFTLLTTASNKQLEWLHDRMPVVLPADDAVDSWLNCADLSVEDLSRLPQTKNLFCPSNAPELVWHPVHQRMNKLTYKGADAAEPLDVEAIRRAEEARSIKRFFGTAGSSTGASKAGKKRLQRPAGAGGVAPPASPAKRSSPAKRRSPARSPAKLSKPPPPGQRSLVGMFAKKKTKEEEE